VGCHLDITERKRAEEKIQAMVAELARSNADLQQFVHVASHDLQEPLRAVAGCVGLIEKGYADKLDDRGRELMQHVVTGARRMQTLIQDLLAYSRVGTRGKDFEMTDASLALDRALTNLATPIRETGASITYDPLPTVMADPTQLPPLFQNLISNAIKFCAGRRPEIHIGAQPRGGDWLFSVRDNGIGIEPQYRERIFVIFQRLHTRTEYPGTGIGLAICKRIIERHKGQIWVDSEPGKGSTFYFTIPRQAEQAA
jgi:light-regulated signal transduction histidine kinase (bacteriophytochrome)